jgi:hypothetical protein
LNQPFVIASQNVGLAMRQMLSFDVLADAAVSICAVVPYHCGVNYANFDIWMCDKSDCTGNLKTNLADVATTPLNAEIPMLHVKATFARKNATESSAVLVGNIELTEPSGLSNGLIGGWVVCGGTCANDGYGYVASTASKSSIDLSTGNRYIVITLTITSSETPLPSSDTVQATLLRVNMVP